MLSLAVFTTLFASLSVLAAPQGPAGAPARSSGCRALTTAKVPIPTTQTVIPASVAPVTVVAIGVGTQNYTCSAAGTYTGAGAVADIFDIGCAVGRPGFNALPDVAMRAWSRLPAGVSPAQAVSVLPGFLRPELLGKHYFISNAAGGITPRWDFIQKLGSNGFVNAALAGSIAAPTGAKDVNWLKLNGVAGGLATEVYRTDTRLGQPPASCTPGSAPIQVKYVSNYWFAGGFVKP